MSESNSYSQQFSNDSQKNLKSSEKQLEANKNNNEDENRSCRDIAAQASKSDFERSISLDSVTIK